jgi:exopolyphosphatase/guanosine-5'-triphosphate,3'-diphosphate pyrophosphatase
LVRVPLRLGDDVYNSGKISKEKERQFMYTLKSFKLLMKAYGVKAFKAYATSAMREANNKEELIKELYKKTGIQIETIGGKREAELIFSTFYTQPLPENEYLFIDVGGGSTELSYILDGKKMDSHSFQLGTVRSLRGKNKEGVWQEIESWLAESSIATRNFAAIGTGGNINRVAKFQQKKYLEPVTHLELKQTFKEIASYSYEDRIDLLRLKPDRADVIIPALEIYDRIMELGAIKNIYVPKMGLADGMVLEQYFENIDKDIFF